MSITKTFLFPAHRVNEEILWDLNEQDLKDMDINEKGPIKIILKYIAKKDCLEEDTGHSSTQGQPEVVSSKIQHLYKWSHLIYKFLILLKINKHFCNFLH